MTDATITIPIDTATPMLDAIKDDLAAGGISEAVSVEAYRLTRDHLMALNSQRHRHGAGFYEEAANNMLREKTPDEVSLTIRQQGIRQRRYGGYIRPKNTQWIAVPARQEAIAARPGQFTDLHFVFFHTGLAALVQTEGDTGRGSIDAKGEGGGVFWWLKKEVYQKPDETVLPANALIVQTALGAATTRIATLTRRGSAQP